jgi:hypothetical protein
MVYLIFARKEYQQPLELIGEMKFDGTPPEPELNSRARTQFDGDGWLEMVAVPDASIISVIPTEVRS